MKGFDRKSRQGTTTIVRYPNRRLYCPVKCDYITFAEVGRRILAREPVKIVTSPDDNDVTKEVVLRMLVDRAKAGTLNLPLLPLLDLFRKFELSGRVPDDHA